MARSKRLKKSELALREIAIRYPEAHEDFPWGHRAIKVRGRAFVFLAHDDGKLSMSVKLPRSNEAALALPFASPTGYGLGRSGWVTARFAPRDAIPLELLEEWLRESYLAIAPKRLGRTLDEA